MLLLWAATAFASPFALDLTVETLDNGMTVVIEEQKRSDVVVMLMRFEVGSRDEQDGGRGVAHLFEHMAFAGSRNVPPDDFARLIEDAGGYWNAGTGRDNTTYELEVPSGAVDLALFLESDRVAFLKEGLTDEKMKNQQDVVLRERDENYSSGHGRDNVAMDLTLYPEGHPYRTSWLDVEADIRGFGTDIAGDFWETYYRPSNSTMVIVGNVDTDEVLATVKHWFSDVPDRGEAPPRRAAPDDPVWPRANHFLEADVEDYNVYALYPAPGRDHPDYAALEVLGYVMSWGRGTRFDDRLEWDHALSDGASFYYDPRPEGGMLVFDLISYKKRLPRMIRAADKVFAELQETPPTQAEMDRARLGLRNGMRDTLVTSWDRATVILDCTSDHGKPDCLEDWWASIEAVTPEEVQRVARAWVVPERRSLLSVVPRRDKGKGKGAMPGAVELVVPE